MEELKNLQQMAILASGRFNAYDGEDFILPQIFKDQVKEINSIYTLVIKIDRPYVE